MVINKWDDSDWTLNLIDGFMIQLDYLYIYIFIYIFIHTYIIGHYNPSVRIIDLVSHIYIYTYIFIYKITNVVYILIYAIKISC